jgi:predicted P-loop ATPase
MAQNPQAREGARQLFSKANVMNTEDPKTRFTVIEGGADEPKRDDGTDLVAVKKNYWPVKAAIATFPLKYSTREGAIKWPDQKKDWNGLVPKATCTNTRIAIQALAIECSRDEFHDRRLIGGALMADWAGELSDNAIQMLRVLIHDRFDFDPGTNNAYDAAVQLCNRNRFDPVLDYLDAVDKDWDGISRLDEWLMAYMGVLDTPLNRQIGRLVLIAAVRRARQPGVKFDQIPVLEGPEGLGKSQAIQILAGPENFSDQTILGLNDRQQQEAVQGIWLYEIADLSGIGRAETESIKAFGSRTHDRVRPAYGRCRIDLPRRCIFVATTNDSNYLKSQTGNRRFWPVKTGRVDLGSLARDRDLLWGEASRYEAAGASIILPESLWSAAGAEQEARREVDPWEDILAQITGTWDCGEYRISSQELLWGILKIPEERQTRLAMTRVKQCMNRLGWEGPDQMRICQNKTRGYRRGTVPDKN